jgi:hypothetical protein
VENTAVFNLLASSIIIPGVTETTTLYSPLIGSWDITARWHLPGRDIKEAKGEWHFIRILGGRVVQDVLFQKGSSPDQYGITLRGYDSTQDIWHVTWMQPGGGEFVNLAGRKAGDRIIHVGRGSDSTQQERWSFINIKEESFIWLGEVSRDGGVTWELEQEMLEVKQAEG